MPFLGNFRPERERTLILEPKLTYLGIFELQFLETIVTIEIITLKLIKNEFLANTVNFCTGSAFSEVQGPLLVHFIKYAG